MAPSSSSGKKNPGKANIHSSQNLLASASGGGGCTPRPQRKKDDSVKPKRQYSPVLSDNSHSGTDSDNDEFKGATSMKTTKIIEKDKDSRSTPDTPYGRLRSKAIDEGMKCIAEMYRTMSSTEKIPKSITNTLKQNMEAIRGIMIDMESNYQHAQAAAKTYEQVIQTLKDKGISQEEEVEVETTDTLKEAAPNTNVGKRNKKKVQPSYAKALKMIHLQYWL